MDDLEKFREMCCKEGVLKIHARYLRRVIREAPSSLINQESSASLHRYLHFIVLFALMCQLIFFYTWPVLPDRTITPLEEPPVQPASESPSVPAPTIEEPPPPTTTEETCEIPTLTRQRPLPPFQPLETLSNLEDAIRKLTPENKIPILISMIPYARTGWGTFSISLVQETLRSTRFHPIIKPEGCTYVLNRNQVPSDVIELHDEQQLIRDSMCSPGWETRYIQVPFAVVRSFYVSTDINHQKQKPTPQQIHAVNGGFEGQPDETDTSPFVWGIRNLAVVFMEKAELNEAQSLRASYYDAVIAGSSWNARGVARSLKRHGVSIGPKEKVGVHAVLQGVRTIKSPSITLLNTTLLRYRYITTCSHRKRSHHPNRFYPNVS